MIQIHFYELGECAQFKYIKDWPNWTGEVPKRGDIVRLHFGDKNEEEVRYRVINREIDGTKPNNLRINVCKVIGFNRYGND